VRAILTVAHLTFQEARRRRVLAASLGLGAAFVAIFATGLYFIVQDMRARMPPVQQGLMISFVVTAALYAANFLIVVTSVLVAVDTVAGEIASGVIETLCTKPVARAAIILGKWLGCWLLLVAYLGLTVGGVLAVARAIAGYTPPHAAFGVSLMLLEGTLLGNPTARYLGIAASLLVPSESLWLLAAHHMQPPLARDLNLTPFSPASVPSPAMVAWALGYVLVTLMVGLRLFRTRDL